MTRTLTRLGLLGCFAIASLATILPAAAQTGSDIRFVNPEALGPSRGYTYLVDANRPGRILYLAEQLGFVPGEGPHHGGDRLLERGGEIDRKSVV